MRRAAATMLAAMLPAVGLTARQPVFRSGVEVVRIDASVMRGLNPVVGLTADHFEITDNGVIQRLDSVSLDRVPLSLTLLLDTSGSLEGEGVRQLIAAASGLIQALRPDDGAALMTFAESVRTLSPMSTDRTQISSELRELSAGGATSLSDAVFLALQLSGAKRSLETRSALLVFSDGQDTASFLSTDQSIDAAKRSQLLIHSVELTANGRPSDFATRLADTGGGRVWMASRPRDLSELFGRVLNELRARYLLTYSPSNTQAGWHDVKVRLKGARGEVTARPGYFVE